MDQTKEQMTPNQQDQPAVGPTKASRFGIWRQKLKLPSWWEEKIRSGLWWWEEKIRSGLSRLWETIKQYPFVMAIILVLLLIAFTFATYLFKWEWTGFNSGPSQITISSASKVIYTATVPQPSKTLWDWLLLLSSIATTSAIVAGGLWFIISRSLAQEAQVSLSHKHVFRVKRLLIAIVEVRIKNLARTQIKNLYFSYTALPIDLESNSKPDPKRIILISEDSFEKINIRGIFTKSHRIEPNEEKSWDIAFAFDMPTLFKLTVTAVTAAPSGNSTVWESVAVFNVDDKAKVPT